MIYCSGTVNTTLRHTLERILFCVLIIGIVAAGFFYSTAHAATSKTPALVDRALLTAVSNRVIVLPPGKGATVWFDFKNIGTSTWTNQDPHPVSLNTDNRMFRKSKFEVKQWRASWRPARLSQKTVKPGETGRIRFGIKAPNKPGVWRETFTLVRDKDTRITGGTVEMIIVINANADGTTLYQTVPKQSQLSFWVRPGARIYQSVSFKNTGKATWRNEGWGTVTLVHDGPSVMAPASSEMIAAPVPGAILKSTRQNEMATATINMTAPTVPGTYIETFWLNGPYGPVTGSTITASVTVSDEPQPPLAAEPIVRVGIYAPAKPVIIAANAPYEARNATTGEVLATVQVGQTTTTTYDAATSRYKVELPTEIRYLSDAPRFVPLTTDTIMEIRSYSDKRSTTIDGVATIVNDNKFRGTIEVRYATATSKLWVINELPLESYLKGLGETGSRSPVEFAKTLITAARSYAMFHYFYGAKHRTENYHINSSTDQVYRGYNYEIQTPNITQAVAETRGMVVTHPSMIDEKNTIGTIVAAYSSCTDGRTRSYVERWGGDPNQYPYLLSVPDPLGICSDGNYPASYMTGGSGNHMVGMSAYGALKTITQQSLTFDAVLKYYYTGVSIIKAYL